jgi:Fe-S oxidoreductase
MLDTAERWLKQLLRGMQGHIQAGTPIVILEPSCYAVFKDELVNLLPNNQDAHRLKQQTYVLAEFLDTHAPDFQVPRLYRKALAHGHCHQKALIKMTAEEKVLNAMGVDVDVLDSGCCGMAGAFGFEAEHYDTSLKVGELVLVPAVRAAAKDTLLVADGFSCREQISQTTDRHALHLAQVLQMAMHDGARGPSGAYPERKYVTPTPRSISPWASLAAIAGFALVVAAVLRRAEKKR